MALARDFRILIVDDEQHMLTTLTLLLEADYTTKAVESAEDALEAVPSFRPDLVLLDITLPGMDGMECLKRIKAGRPHIEVVMVTATRDVRTAVSALKLGAYDYITKPFEEDELRGTIRNVKEKLSLRDAVERLGGELARPYKLENIVGKSRVMKDVLKLVERVAARQIPVLIQGESGTGKELVARAIHYNGPRAGGPFVAANCARFSGDLIDSELFGHEKGAFTGATGRRAGLFEQADRGTLFLDEVASMPYETQGKLLRVIEERRFSRVGGGGPVEADVRLVAATNRDLAVEVDEGRFREDLYYRLRVVPVSLPPLRARRRDIPLLVNHFIRKHREHMDSRLEGVSREAMEVLKKHTWRGNVRELENTILLLMSVSDKQIADVEDLDVPVLRRNAGPGEGIRKQRAEADREAVTKALEQCRWNQSAAAGVLGVHRNTLRSLMKRYGIPARRSG
jgi:DNA-binding NtrC family response regulator